MPAYLVPPDTRRMSLTAASTVPAQVELQSPAGGIDVFGDLQQAQAGSTISTATVREQAPAYVGQGYWFTYVQEIGPYGAGRGASRFDDAHRECHDGRVRRRRGHQFDR